MRPTWAGVGKKCALLESPVSFSRAGELRCTVHGTVLVNCAQSELAPVLSAFNPNLGQINTIPPEYSTFVDATVPRWTEVVAAPVR